MTSGPSAPAQLSTTGPTSAPPKKNRARLYVIVSVVVGLLLIVASLILITHLVAQSQSFRLVVTDPGDASTFLGMDKEFCPPQNAVDALGSGRVYLTWLATSGTVIFEVVGPAPETTIVYSSIGNSSSGSGTFTTAGGVSSPCDIYFFGILDPVSGAAVVSGQWDYLVSQAYL